MKKLILLGLCFSSLLSKEINIKIQKMHCPLCTTMIKKVVQKVDGVKSVKVRLNTKIAKVDFDESKTSTEEILKAIKSTSYTGIILDKKD
ncbi:hypothetical protein ALC152_20410 [Arcobacter sp. 15-2]|uniref:heavy-metal-associated domain-containing protein n=1 Tax=Arcobacter sp. 15-2 TaxID=3374109 RepID=UPI00399D23BB